MASTIKVHEYLRYDFTEAEFLEHARLLGKLNQDLSRAEERKKRVSSELAADVKARQDEVSSQSRLVSNGYEYRDIECEVRYHDPENGKKTLVRMDSGETVKVSFMSGDEMQASLPLEMSTDATAAP